jgi:AcrR family transcriptional regulator
MPFDAIILSNCSDCATRIPMAPGRTARRPAKPVRAPRQRRARATVEAIVDAAARILVERGWPGFNTNAIAARAGVSVGSLYEYFPDKQALLERLLLRHLAEAEAQLAAAGPETDPQTPEALVRMLVDGFVSVHREDPALHRVLSSEVPLPAELRARVDGLLVRIVERVEGALTGRVPSPAVTARLLVDTVDAVVHRWYVDDAGAPLPPEALTTELERMLGGYLAAVALAPPPGLR